MHINYFDDLTANLQKRLFVQNQAAANRRLRKRGKTNKHQQSTKLGIGSGRHNNIKLQC
jgi:hypothetical protein